ncbi:MULTISPECIES: hypothetical protein [unclassified Vibrio]|uniref:hypothetical protein n=1 Tax=unclassified Vibrio TaxID=2614977 RepID=UPI00355275AD
MKYRNFLSQNFWLWFVPWNGLFIFSLCLLLNDVELGKFLLSFAGTSLIALLTAMAAFNNMDVNEKKKRARDEYLAYVDLLQIVCERYYLLRNLIGHSNRNNHIDWFCRGLFTPYIVPVTDFKSADFGRFYFLSRKMTDKHTVGTEVEESQQAFNTVYYTQLEGNLKAILSSIQRRNDLYERKIFPVLTTLKYIGQGSHSIQANDFENDLSYFEFTNFLQFSEEINKHLCELIQDYKKIAETLANEARELFDEEILAENGGFTSVHFPEEKQPVYIPLSEQQLTLLNASNYPSRSYRDRNQVAFEFVSERV